MNELFGLKLDILEEGDVRAYFRAGTNQVVMMFNQGTMYFFRTKEEDIITFYNEVLADYDFIIYTVVDKQVDEFIMYMVPRDSDDKMIVDNYIGIKVNA